MSLFTKKPTAIVYIRRQDIVFINKKTSVRLDIPVDLVQNLEVNDSAKLSELVSSFLDQQECHKQRVLVALDPTVLFQRDLPVVKPENLPAQTAEFEQILPFDVANRQSIVIAEKGKMIIFGTNRPLLQAIALGVQKSNKVLAILPVSLYGVSDSKSVNLKIITALFSNTTPLKQPGFSIKM